MSNTIRGKYMLLFLLNATTIALSAQIPFRGSFLMTFTSSPEKNKAESPLLWNVDEGKMVMEIQDEMKKKGVSKRVLFDPADSTWTMGLEFGNVKQGTRIHANAMFRDSAEQKKIKVKVTSMNRMIAGYNCHQVLIESNDYSARLWVTDEISFNLSRMYKMLAHCGMMSDFVEEGDWFLWKNKKGMILEVTSTEKQKQQSYTMSISRLSPGTITSSLFIFKGYRISDIPEGERCGPAVKEK